MSSLSESLLLFDVLVIGGGPAGLSAALNLGIGRRATLVVDSYEYRNAVATESHGFLTHDGEDPAKIRAASRADVAKYSSYVTIADGMTVTEIRVRSSAEMETPTADIAAKLKAERKTTEQRAGFRFQAKLEPISSTSSSSLSSSSSSPLSPLSSASFESSPVIAKTVLARAIVLASGMKDKYPDIEGFMQQWGRGIFSCPFCDGHDRRDSAWGFLSFHEPKPLVLNAMVPMLRTFSSSLTLLTHGNTSYTAVERHELERVGIQLIDSPVIKVTPVTRVEGEGVELLFANGETRHFRAVVCHPPSSLSQIATSLGLVPCPAAFGGVERRAFCQAVTPASIGDGVYVCGDLADPKARIAGAVGSGADAGAGVCLLLAQLEWKMKQEDAEAAEKKAEMASATGIVADATHSNTNAATVPAPGSTA